MELDALLTITKAIGVAESATRDPQTLMLANRLFLHCKRIHKLGVWGPDDREGLRSETLNLITELEGEDLDNAAERVGEAMELVVDLYLDD